MIGQCSKYFSISTNRTIASICVFFIAGLFFSYGANPRADSLKNKLAVAKPIEKAAILNQLSQAYKQSDISLSKKYAEEALQNAIPYNDPKDLGDAYNNLGRCVSYDGEYQKAIDYFLKSFTCRQKLGDSSGMANLLSNIGVMYRRMSDFTNALDYYQRSLELKERIGDKREILSALNNIGGLYYYQNNLKRAEEYYNRAVKLGYDVKDTNAICYSLNNLALIYDDWKDYKKAIELNEQVFAFRTKLEDDINLSVTLNNLGRIYMHLGNNRKSLDYFLKALALNRKTGDFQDRATTFYFIGKAYHNLKDFSAAIINYDSSLALASRMGQRREIRDAYHGLAYASHYLGRYDRSLEYFSKYIDINDSIFNEESLQRVSEMEVKYQMEQKLNHIELLKAENKVKDLQQLESRQRQKYVLIGGGLSLIILLVFILLLVNRSNIRKRAHAKLQQFNDEILRQKAIVDEKNKEILDSITYARRIQSAILPTEEEFLKKIKDGFILFQPKDIVSGDFYWFAETDSYLFIAAVDCTGHGVPGGFMSMLGNSLLNEIVIEKRETEPAEILDVLRLKVILSLKQRGESMENKDGMDMTLVRLDKNFTELICAAANNPLYFWRQTHDLIADDRCVLLIEHNGGKLFQFLPDKQPVGISSGILNHFTQFKLTLKKGDRFYLFTDGFADQFGGPKGKKLKYRAMQKMIIDSSDLSMQEQKSYLESEFHNWKGKLEQVDDVLIIGVTI